MKVFTVVACVLMAFVLFIMLRAFVVHSKRMGWIRKAHNVSGEMILQGKENFMEPWDRYDKSPSFHRMVWQLFRFHWELDLSDLERGD